MNEDNICEINGIFLEGIVSPLILDIADYARIFLVGVSAPQLYDLVGLVHSDLVDNRHLTHLAIVKLLQLRLVTVHNIMK